MTGTVADMLNAARSQIGYNGAGTEDNPDTKYGQWFGYNYPAPSAQWCDMFLSWCADQAGVDLLPPPKGSAGVAATWNAYQAAGLTTASSPRAGDFIVFNYSDHPNHIGIVESVDSPSQLTTIQGNTTDAGIGRTGNCCRRKIVNRGSSYIVGYCRPQYRTTSTKPTGSGSADTSAEKDWFDMATKADFNAWLKEAGVLTKSDLPAIPSADTIATVVWNQAGKRAGLGNGQLRNVLQTSIKDQGDRVIAAIEGLPGAIWDEMNARLRKDGNALWRLGQAVTDRINQNGYANHVKGMAKGLGLTPPADQPKETTK